MPLSAHDKLTKSAIQIPGIAKRITPNISVARRVQFAVALAPLHAGMLLSRRQFSWARRIRDVGANCKAFVSAMRRFCQPIILAAAILCGTATASGQSKHGTDLRVGKLLVSSRGLPDPNFVESVVLLIQYDEQGSVDLMINRRTQVPISHLLKGLN